MGNKIKKHLLIILISLSLVSVLSAVQKTAKSDKAAKIVVTGYVVSKGNMPFVYPVIQTEDGTEYMISCKDKVKQKLLNKQGYLIKFTGKLDNGVFVLKKYKVQK